MPSKEPFEPELSKTFKAYNYHYRKLSVASNPNIRFLHKPPYDFYVLNGGKFNAIEAKCCRKRVTSFPFDRVEDHQIEGLLDAARRMNGVGYIFVNFRNPKNEAFAVKVEDFIQIREELMPRKSIPRVMFDTDDRFKPFVRKNINGVVVWVMDEILGESDVPRTNENN